MEEPHGKAGGAVEMQRSEGLSSARKSAGAQSELERPITPTPNRHRYGGAGGRLAYHLLRILLGGSNSR